MINNPIIRTYAPLKSKYLAIFDRDDTVILDIPARKPSDEIVWTTGAIQALSYLYNNGVDLAIASNQGSIARNQITVEDVLETNNLIQDMAAEHGFGFSTIAFCPHHPDGALGNIYAIRCQCRKPEAGLITAIIEHSPALKIVFFGDKQTDILAAKVVPHQRVTSVLIDSKVQDLLSKAVDWLAEVGRES